MSVWRALLGAGLLLLGHAGMLRLAAEWSFVAALLSPGPHSGLPALLFGLTFLAARLAVYVVLPALGAGALTFRLVSWALPYFSRPWTSPSRRPAPMLSGPVRGSEVADGKAK